MSDHSNSRNRRRFLKQSLGLAGIGAAASQFPSPALAQERVSWKMVTAWPKNLPGPGMMARRITERVSRMSGGRFEITLYAAGELAPAFGVLDAVAGGVAEMGHATAFYWLGKVPEATYFTAVPYGLTASQHTAWVEQGDGQALWDKVYAPLGVRPFMAGNIGMSMLGWFHKPIEHVEDFQGLKIRSPGLGGAVYEALGASALTLPASDLFMALKTQRVDAVEFLGPWNDYALGLHKAGAGYYYGPGAMKPNGPSEAVVSIKAFDDLPSEFQEILVHAIATENHFALSEAEGNNIQIIETLGQLDGLTLGVLPSDVASRMKAASADVVREHASKSDLSGEIYASYAKAMVQFDVWSRYSFQPFLATT